MAKIVNHRTEKKVKAMQAKKGKRLRVPKESPMLDIDEAVKTEVRAANKRIAKGAKSKNAVPVLSTDDVELGYYEYYDYEIQGKSHTFIRAYINIKGGKPEMVIGSGQDPMAASRTILAKYNQRNKTTAKLFRGGY